MKCDSCKEEFSFWELFKIKGRTRDRTILDENMSPRRLFNPFIACWKCFQRWDRVKTTANLPLAR